MTSVTFFFFHSKDRWTATDMATIALSSSMSFGSMSRHSRYVGNSFLMFSCRFNPLVEQKMHWISSIVCVHSKLESLAKSQSHFTLFANEKYRSICNFHKWWTPAGSTVVHHSSMDKSTNWLIQFTCTIWLINHGLNNPTSCIDKPETEKRDKDELLRFLFFFTRTANKLINGNGHKWAQAAGKSVNMYFCNLLNVSSTPIQYSVFSCQQDISWCAFWYWSDVYRRHKITCLLNRCVPSLSQTNNEDPRKILKIKSNNLNSRVRVKRDDAVYFMCIFMQMNAFHSIIITVKSKCHLCKFSLFRHQMLFDVYKNQWRSWSRRTCSSHFMYSQCIRPT